MKHRIFAILLTFAVLLSAIPAMATETTEPTVPERAPDYCGESIRWVFADGLLTITGTGVMDDFEDGAPWEAHRDEIKKVIISGGITYIGAYSFCDYDKLKNVEFGDEVYEIGQRAFFSCDSLTVIHLPESFKVFGEASFMGCSKLTEFHCQGRFPSFRLNCLWDTYATIYFPADRPWKVENIQDLEEAFKGRIEFLASDGSDPYEPTEAPAETEAPTEVPTTEPTQAPTTIPATTEAPTEAPVTEPAPPVEDTTEASTAPVLIAPAPTEPAEEEAGFRIHPGLLIAAGVAAAAILIGMLCGGRKKGKYSR